MCVCVCFGVGLAIWASLIVLSSIIYIFLRLTSLDYRQGVTAVGAALAGGLAALPRRYGAVVDAAQCCHVGMVRWWRTF